MQYDIALIGPMPNNYKHILDYNITLVVGTVSSKSCQPSILFMNTAYKWVYWLSIKYNAGYACNWWHQTKAYLQHQKNEDKTVLLTFCTGHGKHLFVPFHEVDLLDHEYTIALEILIPPFWAWILDH